MRTSCQNQDATASVSTMIKWYKCKIFQWEFCSFSEQNENKLFLFLIQLPEQSSRVKNITLGSHLSILYSLSLQIMPVQPGKQMHPLFSLLHVPPFIQSSQLKLQSLPNVLSRQTEIEKAQKFLWAQGHNTNKLLPIWYHSRYTVQRKNFVELFYSI